MTHTGIQHIHYADGQMLALDTRYPDARGAVLSAVSYLAKATPLSDARRAVRALETQLKSHRLLDAMAEQNGWAPRSFVAQIETELVQARRALVELEG